MRPPDRGSRRSGCRTFGIRGARWVSGMLFGRAVPSRSTAGRGKVGRDGRGGCTNVYVELVLTSGQQDHDITTIPTTTTLKTSVPIEHSEKFLLQGAPRRTFFSVFGTNWCRSDWTRLLACLGPRCGDSQDTDASEERCALYLH